MSRHRHRDDLHRQMDELRDAACDFDGVEVPESLWPAAQAVVAEDAGFTLGPARGPGGAWRRLYPPEED